LYADNYKGISCPGRLPKVPGEINVYSMGDGEEYRPRWYELLGAQLKVYANRKPRPIEDDSWQIENPLFLCPTVPEWTNSRNYPYGYNFQFLGNPRQKVQGGFINWPVRATRIKASLTVMAADAIGTAAGKPSNLRGAYRGDGLPSPNSVGNKGWALDPPRLTNVSDYADGKPSHRLQDRSAPDPRHMGKSNVIFCDGHVELMSPPELGYVVNGDGSMDPFPPGAHNRMFSGTGRDDDPPRGF
jgi:prepilin-type processing-associated H-X9-DG protein